MTARFGRLAIGIALVGAALAYLVFAGTRKNLVYYYEIGELEAAAARTAGPIRLSGDVVAGTVEREAETRTLRFAIQAAEGGATVPVAYGGTVPDIFRPGIQVVVEGRLGPDGTFQAETLLAKCPSKYQAAGELPRS
ncbi:MAG: cytochrome c maturation protein CcmE [Gemmatimonadota bacterium]